MQTQFLRAGTGNEIPGATRNKFQQLIPNPIKVLPTLAGWLVTCLMMIVPLLLMCFHLVLCFGNYRLGSFLGLNWVPYKVC